MDAWRRNGYTNPDAHGHADIDPDAHGNADLDAHCNEDDNPNGDTHLDAGRGDGDANEDAHEDGNAGWGNRYADEDTDADACEHSDAYADSYAGWLNAGCVHNPLLRGIARLYPRLAPDRGGLVC